MRECLAVRHLFSRDKRITGLYSTTVRERKWLMILLVFGLPAALLIAPRISRERESADGTAGIRKTGSSDESVDANTGNTRKSNREKTDVASAQALQEMEKEFDRILPAKSPTQSSSLYDACLKPGESLILGGFKTATGDYEFTAMQVDPADASFGRDSYIIRMKTMTMKPEKSRELGLGTLLSPARMRIQKGLILPSGDATWAESAVSVMTAPTVISKAGQTATVELATEQILEVTPGHFETVMKGHFVSVIADRGSDGQSARVRTRIESPADRNGD